MKFGMELTPDKKDYKMKHKRKLVNISIAVVCTVSKV